ncbi:acetylxylan esterase [Mucilaginibacter sp. BJC16-A38]|uniref:glucuronyl esterase domain-containing protein n=1 Tax=Mucilaginibacter phenanthrenivorans TaxID=1234842 RepID=UPI002158689F|nr:acetylxylan esterase [Mucilaginibacter phenanthrenivorans]MCR8560030.1 acetylxylan esterase [Mucilaginibacter phenanthrenivorans]
MKKVVYLLIFAALRSAAQNTASSPQGSYPALVTFTAEQDHQNMMDQLGIKSLRPGPSGDERAPNHANYDESMANPCPQLPDVLTLKNGEKVASPAAWWNTRRPEIVDDMEREVYGRLPANLPKVTWETKFVDHEYMGFTPIIAKQLIGHVDNSVYPLINVNIEMMVVLPANAKGPVPLLMMFGQSRAPSPSQPNPAQLEELNNAIKKLLLQQDPALQKMFDEHPAYQLFTSSNPVSFGGPARQPTPGPIDQPGVNGVNNDPPSAEQLIANGWGFAYIDPSSIQADNGAGLTRGIIGLVNKGQPRKPDDWGALRAWSWGAARGLDYLEASEPQVDVKHVGIEGVSRYGKAALVTLAFEPRFAMGLIGSSGEGGTKLNRRNWGEAVESLTGGEYYWMAGNFMKYGAAEAKSGSKTACDLPVDSHELIALCAPRLVFISYGIPEKGDAKWLDHQGSYMAAVAAGTVFKLLGVKDLGVSNNCNIEKMPPVNTPMLDGQLAWRQHDQGHQDQANMKWFLKWADKNIGHQSL